MQSKGTSLFAQILQLVNRNQFAVAVRSYNGDRYVKGFPTWDHFVSMLFCHLAQAKSMREISAGLRSSLGKLSHMGVRKAPIHSTLAYANEHRDWRIYQRIFFDVLALARSGWDGKRKVRIKSKLYSIDATVIDVCLAMFDWAKFRRRKGAVKLHMVLDHDGYLPCFAHITDGKTHEVKALKRHILPHFFLEPGSIVVYDRGYIDYALLSRWMANGVFFVTRLKDNARFKVKQRRDLPERTSVIVDQEIVFTGFYASKDCPHLLRRIVVYDEEQDREIVLLTNHLDFAASTIAAIYKDRWAIETFFKTIKQHLRIKTFVGTSKNAVMVQLWTALIAILLLKYIKMLSSFPKWSFSTMIALLHFNLFTYRDLRQWLNDPMEEPPYLLDDGQLAFPGFGQQTGG